MELNKLNSRAMLALSEYWLQEPFMRARFREHDLGVAVRVRLREVYGDLTELYAPHLVYGIRSLVLATDQGCEQLRALAERVHGDLEERIMTARTPATARRIRCLKEVLFPGGPASLATPTSFGVSRRLARAQKDTSPDNHWFTRLRSVEVAEGKLMDAYRAWAVIEDRRSNRARKYGLHDVSGRTMNAAAKVRHKWLGVAQAVYTAVSLMPWPDDVRVRVYQQLEESVATIVQRVMAGPDSSEHDSLLQDILLCSDEFDESDTLEFDPEAFDVIEEPAQPSVRAP